MTNITQADRDMAANSMTKLVAYAWNDRTIELVRSGQRDDIHLVQDFAAHRISTSPSIPEVGKDVEARARELYLAELKAAAPDTDWLAWLSGAATEIDLAALRAIVKALSNASLAYARGVEDAAKAARRQMRRNGYSPDAGFDRAIRNLKGQP